MAEGEFENCRYTFKRTGFLHPRVTIRRLGSEENLGLVRLTLGGNGTLEFTDGKRYSFHRLSFWTNRWGFSDEQGNLLLSMRIHTPFVRHDGEVVLEAGKGDQYTSIMILLGWYMIAQMAEEGEDRRGGRRRQYSPLRCRYATDVRELGMDQTPGLEARLGTAQGRPGRRHHVLPRLFGTAVAATFGEDMFSLRKGGLRKPCAVIRELQEEGDLAVLEFDFIGKGTITAGTSLYQWERIGEGEQWTLSQEGRGIIFTLARDTRSKYPTGKVEVDIGDPFLPPLLLLTWFIVSTSEC